MPTWAVAFVVALAVAVIAVMKCRQLALNIAFVDIPDDRKSHPNAVPYLGGIGLILGVLAGLIFEYPIGIKVMLVALAATVLGTIGLVDDDRTVKPTYRFAAEAVAAAIATAAGLRIHASGIEAFDILLTLLWIVGITNAINLLDNMDGLAGGLTAVAACAVFALAVAEGQPVIATLAAATVGSCLGFLAFNRPPASIFMGDSGSLFLGFLIAVMTVDVDSALPSPASFLVPLLVLGIPIVDTTMVTLARVRRRRSPFIGGRDHLSHRLVAGGRTPERAVALLLATEAVVAATAVLAGRRVVPLGWAVLGAGLVLWQLAVRTARVPVYLEPVVGLPKAVRMGLLGLIVALPLVATPATLALVRAGDAARTGAQAAVDAMGALERGDAAGMKAKFAEARSSLAQARDRLNGPLIAMGLAVPGLSSNLHAAQTLVSIWHEFATQGALLAGAYAADSVTVRDGTIPLDEIRKLEPLLARGERLLDRSGRRLADLDRAFIVPSLARALDEAQVQIARQSDRSETAVVLARALPAMLGADGSRRYFLAFQNTAELRGSGGFMGSWGELVADGGRLQIVRFGRQEDLLNAKTQPLKLEGMDSFLSRWQGFGLPDAWQNVNVSPDFPTTGRVISQLYPQSGGRPVDGVIAIDPFGLASLLTLTGPVTVPGWNEPISAANAVEVTLRRAYDGFPQDRPVEFLGDVARATSQALTNANIASPSLVGAALSKAIKEQHIKAYMIRPEEQRLIEALAADGALPDVSGDSLSVVSQNLAANQIDYYLGRSTTYDVRLQPRDRGRSASVQANLQIALSNGAPATGLPSSVIGPYDNRFTAGESRSYLSVYTPFALKSATVSGGSVLTASDQDTGRAAHSLTVSVPSLQAVTVAMDLVGRLDLGKNGWYRLDLAHQSSVQPETVRATVTVPSGWRIVEARNALQTDSRTVVLDKTLATPETIWVRIKRAGLARFTDLLLGES